MNKSHKNKKAYNAYHKVYQLKRYHERRLKALELLGNSCKICGELHDLDIDHVNHSEKSFDISKIWSMKNETFLTELDKCQLLCRTCHLEKTKQEGSLNKNRPNGENIHQSKLTTAQVINIRAEFRLGISTFSELANKYNVSRGNISHIINRATWKHID